MSTSVTATDGATGGTPQGIAEHPSICAAFQAAVAHRPDSVALRQYGSDREITWAQAGEEVLRLAAGLAGLGIGAGDTVAFLLRNRPEFNLLDVAALHLGAVPWSIYLTSSSEQIRTMLEGAGSRVVIAESDLLARVRESLDGTAVEHVIDVEELDRLPAAPDGHDFESAWRAVTARDPLTIIWTSGTTGSPKPVELTHGSMLAVLSAITSVTGVEPGGRLLSSLPSAHVADRWSAHCWWIVLGAELTCVPDIQDLMAATAATRPTIWGSVPRVWEKLRAALEAQGVTDPAALPDEVRAGIRAKLGLDQVETLIVGAAPLAEETLEFFDALGLPVIEIWGMSETTGILTANPPDDRRLGTVGRPLPGVEVKVADDGKLLARGPMLMSRYRDRPEATAETIVDGWIHTGDVGSVDADGYVRILDRKKELIINSGGKNMSPLAIEGALKNAGSLIGQACVIGDRRPFNVALLVLDPEALDAWAEAHGRTGLDYAALTRDREVRGAVAAEVEAANERLSRIEQIKAWVVLEQDWLPDTEEMAPTMKLKRRPIATKYAEIIDDLYASASAAHAASV